jgi:Zn-dependent alcohol dehydrogenase
MQFEDRKVKAAVCRAFGAPLVIEDINLRLPGPGEVHVRLDACAICHSDITYMDGGWGGELPTVFGHEAAGIVQGIGEDVKELCCGTPVLVTLLRSCGDCFFCRKRQESLCETRFSLDEFSPITDQQDIHVGHGLRTGAFAEEVVVHASQVVEIPPDMPMDSAALLSCGVITGVGAVTNVAAVPAGASVATIGMGGVGINCVQGAALSNSKLNIALDLSGDKLEVMPCFGATHVIDPTVEDAPDVVRRLTGGKGTDYVFVAAGSRKAIEQSVQLVRRGGMVVLVGMTAKGVKAEFETLDLANDAIHLVGSKMGSTRLRSDIPPLVEHYRSGRLKLDELVSSRYPLEGINEAIAEVKTGAVFRNVIMFRE